MIRLVPMETQDFAGYIEQLTRAYAADNIRVGRWSAETGLLESQIEIRRLLPSGAETPGQLFLQIVTEDSGERVGWIWLAIEPRGAFVYDLEVFEVHRRRGYAEAAMRSMEKVARERGATKILLQVFGDNTGARRLYAKLGYSEVGVMMSKPLVESGEPGATSGP
jgi:ribosomal protein S18 acetylase RimI-like enzyme